MPQDIYSLHDIPNGKSLRISEVNNSLPVKRRLEELGFTAGEVVEKLCSGAGGNPVAVRVSGAVIAVRSSDAKGILGCEAPAKGGDLYY